MRLSGDHVGVRVPAPDALEAGHRGGLGEFGTLLDSRRPHVLAALVGDVGEEEVGDLDRVLGQEEVGVALGLVLLTGVLPLALHPVDSRLLPLQPVQQVPHAALGARAALHHHLRHPPPPQHPQRLRPLQVQLVGVLEQDLLEQVDPRLLLVLIGVLHLGATHHQAGLLLLSHHPDPGVVLLALLGQALVAHLLALVPEQAQLLPGLVGVLSLLLPHLPPVLLQRLVLHWLFDRPEYVVDRPLPLLPQLRLPLGLVAASEPLGYFAAVVAFPHPRPEEQQFVGETGAALPRLPLLRQRHAPAYLPLAAQDLPSPLHGHSQVLYGHCLLHLLHPAQRPALLPEGQPGQLLHLEVGSGYLVELLVLHVDLPLGPEQLGPVEGHLLAHEQVLLEPADGLALQQAGVAALGPSLQLEAEGQVEEYGVEAVEQVQLAPPRLLSRDVLEPVRQQHQQVHLVLQAPEQHLGGPPHLVAVDELGRQGQQALAHPLQQLVVGGGRAQDLLAEEHHQPGHLAGLGPVPVPLLQAGQSREVAEQTVQEAADAGLVVFVDRHVLVGDGCGGDQLLVEAPDRPLALGHAVFDCAAGGLPVEDHLAHDLADGADEVLEVEGEAGGVDLLDPSQLLVGLAVVLVAVVDLELVVEGEVVLLLLGGLEGAPSHLRLLQPALLEALPAGTALHRIENDARLQSHHEHGRQSGTIQARPSETKYYQVFDIDQQKGAMGVCMSACAQAPKNAPQIVPQQQQAIADEMQTPPRTAQEPPTSYEEEETSPQKGTNDIEVHPPSENTEQMTQSVKKSRFVPEKGEGQSQNSQKSEKMEEEADGGGNIFFRGKGKTSEDNRQIEQMIASRERIAMPKIQFETGISYQGEWQGGLREGEGTQVWADGSKYKGSWVRNQAQGQGTLWHRDGDVYEGEWVNDKAHGRGVYTHANGTKYQGEWKEDKQTGIGRQVWEDGEVYEGEYLDGFKHGRGKLIFKDGSFYEGEFLHNKIHGEGVYVWHQSKSYEGQWRDNKMDGRGEMRWLDGKSYVGEFREDLKEGFGVFCWPDGRRYEGFWQGGKQHGRGEYYLPSGDYKTGEWEQGQRLRWLDHSPQTPQFPHSG